MHYIAATFTKENVDITIATATTKAVIVLTTKNKRSHFISQE